jgi:tetratricopeptide (TPR) repeat protein
MLFVAVTLSHGQSAAMQHLIDGVDYAAQGKLKEAKMEFEKALKVDPFMESAEYSLRVIKDVTDKKIESRTAIHFFKGAAYVLKGQLGEAIVEYDKAIMINPNFAMGYRSRGTAYDKKHHLDKAIADFNRAIEINPRLAMAYFVRGNIYARGSQYEQALSDFNKAIEINPRFIKAYNSRGTTYLLKGQYDQAIADYNRAIEINPKYARAYYNRASAYFDNGEFDKTWEDVHKAQSLGLSVDPAFLYVLRGASGRQE